MLLANSVIASQPQRLILQFEFSLSAEQNPAHQNQIKSIINMGYTLLPQSTDQRWIIVVVPALNEVMLKNVIINIKKLEPVLYVEPGQFQGLLR